MSNTIHILNGDALKDQFPNNINGDVLVMRECLIEGDVSGSDLDTFLSNRKTFIKRTYPSSDEFLNTKVAGEIRQMALLKDRQVCLWFEDDLFCQANLWFLLSILDQSNAIFLVRPHRLTPYGFSAYKEEELKYLLDSKIRIPKSFVDHEIWGAYQSKNFQRLTAIQGELGSDFLFIANAIQAHLDRYPTDGSLGRPKETLKRILKEDPQINFGNLFKRFNQEEFIYGFGDLQVKKMLNEIKEKRN